MKKFLAVLIKSLLVFTAVALAALLIVGMVLLLNWPWWTGFFFVLFFLGLAIGVFLLRKILERRREKRFVNQIVSQDDMQLKGMADRDREQARELQASWTEAMETLKRSHLRKFGNPLYVLPWYLVKGEESPALLIAVVLPDALSPITRYQGST